MNTLPNEIRPLVATCCDVGLHVDNHRYLHVVYMYITLATQCLYYYYSHEQHRDSILQMVLGMNLDQ